MKSECPQSVRVAVVMGKPGSVILERGEAGGGGARDGEAEDGPGIYALPSVLLGEGETFRGAAERALGLVGASGITHLTVLAIVNGGSDPAPDSQITVAVLVDAADLPSLDKPARGFAAFSLDDLPSLRLWTRGVLNAGRTQQCVLDFDGTFLPLGRLAWPVAKKAEGDVHKAGTDLEKVEGDATLEDFAERLRKVRPGGEYKGWLGAASLFGGGLAWSTAVFGTLSEPGQLGGGTALLFWFMTLPIVWAIALRRGFFQPASDRRAFVLRSLLVVVGPIFFLFVGLLFPLPGEALAWMLVLVGIGSYVTVAFRRRNYRGKSQDRATRMVRAMVWATLLFTTVWVLSPGLRELLDGLHHRDSSTTSLDDNAEE